MEVVIVAEPSAAGALVADQIEHLVRSKPNAGIGLATGSSPLEIYRSLIDRYRTGRVSFADTSMYMLDEYVGLPEGHDQSYRAFLHSELLDQLDVPSGRLFGPNVHADDPRAACAEYEARLAASPIDLQILGVGSDGHIGFNEPTSSLSSRTGVKTLTRQTRADNARFFDSIDDVPHHVITQGIGTILDARRVVLIACGGAKAAAVARLVEGPLSAMFPASALQLHPHATIVVDEAAAGMLQLAEYYRDVYANRPAWQNLPDLANNEATD